MNQLILFKLAEHDQPVNRAQTVDPVQPVEPVEPVEPGQQHLKYQSHCPNTNEPIKTIIQHIKYHKHICPA